MKKSELLKEISIKAEITQKKADAVLKAIKEVVGEELANGGEVTLPDLVRLGVKLRDERKGYNPKTKEELVIPAKLVPTCKFTKALKDFISQ